MLEQDRAAVRQRYRKRWEEFGYNSRTLGWDKDCQWVRFSAILEGLQIEEMGSVLDVGCGFGDLLGFLRERGWKGRYTGLDLVPELLDAARKRYEADATAEFLCGDLETVSPSPSDLVVAIGIFNHQVEQGNPAFIHQTIDAMWRASVRVVVCDFLSTSSDPERRQEHLYYSDPVEVFRAGAAYSRRIAIHHAYMPFEFQLKIWRDDSFNAAAPVFAPYRSMAMAQTEWRKRTRK